MGFLISTNEFHYHHWTNELIQIEKIEVACSWKRWDFLSKPKSHTLSIDPLYIVVMVVSHNLRVWKNKIHGLVWAKAKTKASCGCNWWWKSSPMLSWAIPYKYVECQVHGSRPIGVATSWEENPTSKARNGGREEIPRDQGHKRNQEDIRQVQGQGQRLGFAGVDVKRHPKSKVRKTALRQ